MLTYADVCAVHAAVPGRAEDCAHSDLRERDRERELTRTSEHVVVEELESQTSTKRFA
jgi:hypothetical protein